MKSNKLHKKMIAALICLSMAFAANAVTKSTALTLSDLQTQFAAASSAGVRDTINIGAAITVSADLSLVSAGDTVIINMVPYGITVTSGTFTIGNKVKITSADATAGAIQAAGGTVVVNAGSLISATTSFTLQALTGGNIIVNGGYIFSTATSPVVSAGGNVTINGGKIITSNYPAAAAGMSILVAGVATASGGTMTINGGYIATTMSGISRGVGIDYNGICTVNGGEVHSDMGGGRAISINGTNAGGKLYLNGGIVSALGATGRAIQLDNNNSMLWVKGSPTITGGLEAIMVQKIGVAVISGTPTITGVIGTNTTTAKLYDARGLSAIVATPGQGYYAASQNVTVTGGTGTINKYTGASSVTAGVYGGAGITPTTVSSTLVYTTDGTTPVAASTAYSAAVTMAIPSVLEVSPLIDATTMGSPTTLNYWTIGTPMTAAPTPPARPMPKVTSIFSDAYANVAGTDFNPGWGQSGSESVVQVAGNNTLKDVNLNYQGIQFGSPVNALPMNTLHIDMFTTTETSLTISCISPASPANKEFAVALTPLTLNAWNSYDIPLSSFTGVDMSNVIQFKFVGSGGQTSYFDNVYFYNSDPTPDTTPPTAFTAVKGLVAADAVTLTLTGSDNSGAVYYDITYGTTTVTTSGISGVAKSFQVSGLTGATNYSFSVVCRDASGNVAANNPIVVTATTLTPLPGAPVPTIAASNVISVFSDTYTPIVNNVSYFPNWGQTTVGSLVQLSGNNALKYINMNYQGIDLNATIDMSAMNKLHVDVYSPDGTALSIQPISTPAATKVMLPTLTLNAWNSFDILLSTFTNINKATIHQVMFNDGAGKTFYVDNLYFFNDASTGISNVANYSIKCYPSMVSNNLNVTADSEISQVTVRNLLGQSVKSVVVNSTEKSIDLSGVSAGNYLVSVKLANGQSETQKIVKL